MDKEMTPEQFELILEFHQGLIRPAIKEGTIDSAKSQLVNVDWFNAEGNNLATSLKNRFDSLVAWGEGNSTVKFIEIYNKNNTRNPSDNVFHATYKWMLQPGVRGVMNQLSKEYGINPQCMKALKPRLERWDLFAKQLKETL